MSTTALSQQISGNRPRIGSRVISAYYLLTILTGAFVLTFHGRMAFVADVFVGALYLTVTAFLYGVSAANKNRTP